MDWLKAIMIFTMIGFGAALVYVCATLENLVNESGNLKAQIETLKNGHTETKKAIMDTSDRLDAAVDLWNKFNSRLSVIEYAMEDRANRLIFRMDDVESRFGEIETMIENRANESSKVFDTVQNDINEIRGDLMALKANCSELWAGTDAHIEPFIDMHLKMKDLQEFGILEHSRCAVEEGNSTDLEAEMADQK